MPLSSTQCLLSSSLGSREDASSKMKVRRLEAIFRKQTTSDGGTCSPRWTRKRAKNLQNGNLSHSKEIEVAEETKDEEEEEKIVTIGKKGVVVLDQWLPDYMKTNYHVLQLGMDEEQKEEETISIGLFACFREFYIVTPYDFGFKRMHSITHSLFSFTSLLHFLISSQSHIQYLEDKYLDPPQLPHDIHQRAINFQKYIGEKVGADEKLPWTQSVIGKSFMARLQARCARKCNIRCGPGLHHGGFAVENLFLLLVQGLALGDGLFRGEDAVELLAEGAEVLVDKAHHMTIVGSGDVIVACDGCHLRRVIYGGEREKERVGFELVIVGAQEEGVGRGLDAVHMLLILLGLGLRENEKEFAAGLSAQCSHPERLRKDGDAKCRRARRSENLREDAIMQPQDRTRPSEHSCREGQRCEVPLESEAEQRPKCCDDGGQRG
ncbi:hypothetical protein JHK82_031906 [Glycine max]|nr:hypothetical protein JHK85_032568 [Glycine max]KAG4995175.1 hypothetical protein JHK86_032002 [Glycine max]KAG5125169.1 hypothetical protein JHK82_031906 [Glycine max]